MNCGHTMKLRATRILMTSSVSGITLFPTKKCTKVSLCNVYHVY